MKQVQAKIEKNEKEAEKAKTGTTRILSKKLQHAHSSFSALRHVLMSVT